MDYLIEQLDALTIQKTPSDNLSYSDEAAKIAVDYFNKEHVFNKLKDINKFKRKTPVNNLFDPETNLGNY